MKCVLADARDAVGVAVDVSREWTRFFSENRRQLKRGGMLADSKMVQLTVAVARHLFQTGNPIQIYPDAGLFEEALARQRGEPNTSVVPMVKQGIRNACVVPAERIGLASLRAACKAAGTR